MSQQPQNWNRFSLATWAAIVFSLSLGFALALNLGLTHPAAAQLILAGPSAEMVFVRNPQNPDPKAPAPAGLLAGAYVGTSGLELRPAAVISEGAYRGFLLDAGLRVTPKWFGQPEYIMDFVSPYFVLGGSVSYPWSLGWHAKLGLGFVLMQFGSVNAEIGYRYHPLNDTTLLEGTSIGLRATYPF